MKTIDVKFQNELTELINRHSVENIADMPDFILSDMLCCMLEAIGPHIKQNLDWHGCNSVCHPAAPVAPAVESKQLEPAIVRCIWLCPACQTINADDELVCKRCSKSRKPAPCPSCEKLRAENAALKGTDEGGVPRSAWFDNSNAFSPTVIHL